MAEKAQRAANFGNMKIVYNINKRLSVKYNKSSGKTVKAKDGRILTTENEVAERWKTQFEEVLNRLEPEITAEPEPRRELVRYKTLLELLVCEIFSRIL